MYSDESVTGYKVMVYTLGVTPFESDSWYHHATTILIILLTNKTYEILLDTFPMKMQIQKIRPEEY